MTMDLEEMKAKLAARFEGLNDVTETEIEGMRLEIGADLLLDLCFFLRNTDGLYFDQLSSIAAMECEEGVFEVYYHLYSIPYGTRLGIKVAASGQVPTVPSLVEVWPTANWHEREAYDLVGIRFDGHPDLRRILLPDDWEGHPLSKSYQEQALYHGIKVAY